MRVPSQAWPHPTLAREHNNISDTHVNLHHMILDITVGWPGSFQRLSDSIGYLCLICKKVRLNYMNGVCVGVCVDLALLVRNAELTVRAPLRGNASTGRRPDGLSLIKPVLMEAAVYWGRSVPTERWLWTYAHTHIRVYLSIKGIYHSVIAIK